MLMIVISEQLVCADQCIEQIRSEQFVNKIAHVTDFTNFIMEFTNYVKKIHVNTFSLILMNVFTKFSSNS